MQVRAIATGYYGSKVQAPGDTFALSDPDHFSAKWMEPTDALDHDADGRKGGSLPSTKPKAAERIAMARDLTGRDDITTAKEADAILEAAGGADEI